MIFSEPVQLVATGYNHNLVLTKNNKIYNWEKNPKSKGIALWDHLQKIPSKSPMVFCGCGSNHSLIITLDGSLFFRE
jgi:alpha-tubulin suppressor-like RCC1 family protein